MAMRMQLSERDSVLVLDEDGSVVVHKGFYSYDRYLEGKRKGTIL